VFVGGFSLDEVRSNIEDTKVRAKLHGREADHIKFLAGAAVIVGRTQEKAEAKYAEFQRLRSVEGHLAHSGAGLDWTRYPRDERIADIVARKDPGYQRLGYRYKPEQTVGEVLDRVGGYRRGPLFVVGTPEVVADELEGWVEQGGIDGINLRQFLTPAPRRTSSSWSCPSCAGVDVTGRATPTGRRCGSGSSAPATPAYSTSTPAPATATRRPWAPEPTLEVSCSPFWPFPAQHMW
jgi:hypothetical protein